MIELIHSGNLFESGCDGLVNTVNTVGVMGKGLALQFKARYPQMFLMYKSACQRRAIQTGRMWTWPLDPAARPFIINFPTKRHWRDWSKIEWIEEGLVDLVKVVKKAGLKSVAVPGLGCSLGGLKWSVVRPMVEAAATELPDVHWKIYEPY